jgi:trimethylamine corrinoid protein
MAEKEIFERLKACVIDMDTDGACATAEEALATGLDPVECIDQGLSAGMQEISDRFDRAEVFVPQIILASEAFTGAVDILTRDLKGGMRSKGKVIVHTVEGDIHDIGKSILGILLQANGYEVLDLGRDVPVGNVVDTAVENEVDVVTGSALMTTTMPAQREIIEELAERGMRDRFRCVFGGAPTSQEWVDSIGGDGWADNAAAGVDLIRELIDSA